jgi:DNA primase
MSRHFSDLQLYQVRNHIPIRHVIETLLAIPSETVEGVFRFRCPLCAGQHTAVNPKTNLSRCFHCGRNFNAIDLCMLVRHMTFVESVKFLIKRQDLLSQTESKPDSQKNAFPLEQKRAPLRGPVALHEILAELIGKDPREKSTTNRKQTPLASPASNDIAQLEHLVSDLSQILQRLKARLH